MQYGKMSKKNMILLKLILCILCCIALMFLYDWCSQLYYEITKKSAHHNVGDGISLIISQIIICVCFFVVSIVRLKQAIIMFVITLMFVNFYFLATLPLKGILLTVISVIICSIQLMILTKMKVTQ